MDQLYLDVLKDVNPELWRKEMIAETERKIEGVVCIIKEFTYDEERHLYIRGWEDITGEAVIDEFTDLADLHLELRELNKQLNELKNCPPVME